MKEFLMALLKGVNEKEVTSEQKELLRNLLMINAVRKYKNSYYINDNFVCGRLDISQNGTGYLNSYDPKSKQDLIVENKYINNTHIGDIVLAKVISSKKSRVHAKILMCLKPAFTSSVVYTHKFGKDILGINVKTGLASNLKATQKSLKQLPLGTLLKINNIKNEIVEILGDFKDPLVDEKISLALFNKNSTFSEACEEQAKSFGKEVDVSLYPNRVDLRHLPFCTIDPIDAKDFDDAIFYDVEKKEIYIAIADVSEYISQYSPIDKEAKFRGFSIYFPHKSIPMLPRALSENICSLIPNTPRLAFTFKISLDDKFEVKKEELFESIILSKRRFNYDEVDKILKEQDGEEKEIIKWLLPLNEICNKIRAKRLKIGFDFRSSELRMSLDKENKYIKNTRFEISTPSHFLIEDCMLLANKAAAKRIPKGIFRNHGSADIKKVNALLDNLAVFGIQANYSSDLHDLINKIQKEADKLDIREEVDKLIIKAQKKAEYGVFPLGHFGLGFEVYTHFTSPIRRYSDLILHRILKATIENNSKLINYLLLNIEDTCQKINELEIEADKVAYDFMDRKFARWAEENIGNTFKCYINENSNIVTAKLDDKLKGARIFITNFTCDILTPVLVMITDANIVNATIMGRVVKKLDV